MLVYWRVYAHVSGMYMLYVILLHDIILCIFLILV